MATRLELQHKRNALVAQGRAIYDLAAKEKREMTAQETTSFDKYMDESDAVKREIDGAGGVGKGADRGQRLANATRELSTSEGRQVPLEQIDGVDGREAVRRSTRGPAPVFVDKDGREIRGLWHDESIGAGMEHNLPDGIRPEELSLGRLIRAQATRDWSRAQAEKRALGVSPDVLGGYLLPSPIANDVIDLARNKAVVLKAGAVTIPMTANTQTLAKLTADPGFGWKVENQPASFADATFGKVVLTARTLMALCSASVELIEDAGNLDGILRHSLAMALALELDRACLRGDGSAASPVGIRSAQGVQILDQGTNGTSFSSLGIAYAQVSTAIQNIMQKNGEPDSIVMPPRTFGAIDRLVDTLGQPIRPPASYSTLAPFVSNQLPINLTKGSSSLSSEVMVGDFDSMLVGMRTELNIEITRAGGDSSGSAFRNLQVWVRAYLRADMVLAHPEWFAVIDGVIP
jgi:HK97 family phage major capsid protein